MVQPFHSLPYNQQIIHYTQAACRALQAYDIGSRDVDIELLSSVNNATFKVIVEHPTKLPVYFALRIHLPGTAHEASIQSELRWLIALHQDTSLKIPRPICTTTGDLVHIVMLADCPDPLYCVLFGWIDARFLHTSEQDPQMAWQVGQFTATLHQHSQHFSVTASLVPRRLDAANLVDWDTIYRLRKANTLFTDEHLTVFQAVFEQIQQVFQELGQSATTFGLIHADLIWKNYFFHAEGVGALDFDSCGWGYYLYDLAPTLLGYRDEPAYPALRDALLTGYRSVRTLPSHVENYLNPLIAARHLVSCCWLANRLNNPDLRNRATAIVAERMSQMKRLLAADD